MLEPSNWDSRIFEQAAEKAHDGLVECAKARNLDLRS
jgi:hypothetical protein